MSIANPKADSAPASGKMIKVTNIPTASSKIKETCKKINPIAKSKTSKAISKKMRFRLPLKRNITTPKINKKKESVKLNKIIIK